MATVPLPDVPCVRVRLIGNKGSGWEWGNRFYLSYSGSAPSGANCVTLAGDVAAAWASYWSIIHHTNIQLEEVDVLDIATDSGLSGQWTGSNPGSREGTQPPIQCALNVEYGIARRYRGGKPRIYLPAGIDTDMASPNDWTASFITGVQSNVVNFFNALEALSIGSMGTLRHVNLSYYKGFENFTTPSGRERAVPTYRDTALHDNITGYFPKTIIGSQRRRRTSTSA